MKNIAEYEKQEKQFLNNLINFNIESLLEANKLLNHIKKQK